VKRVIEDYALLSDLQSAARRSVRLWADRPLAAPARWRSCSERGPGPGTTRRHRLPENLGAAAIQLTEDDLREIDRAASQSEVHGARYPEHLQQMVGR
jgi:aryl-alcohol dehydrogenase-like predicted oxidoreductase